MSRYLLDTSVLTELLRRQPDPRLLSCLRPIPGRDVSTSVVSVTELRYGTARHPRHAALWAQIERDLLPRITVLPVGEAEAARAGDLLARFAGGEDEIGFAEALIAATALERGLELVTRDPARFSRIPGLSVRSWCA